MKELGPNAPNGLPDARYERRDWATEDALTRKLRENKEKLAARHAELASLKQEVGELGGDPQALGGPSGKSAAWRVGVEQPNPFNHTPPAELPYSHPMARLHTSSTQSYQHDHYYQQQHHHLPPPTKHNGQPQHHYNHHQHNQPHNRYMYNQNETAKKGPQSALASRRAEEERQFLESRENTRRWSAQFGSPTGSDHATNKQSQHARGISI